MNTRGKLLIDGEAYAPYTLISQFVSSGGRMRYRKLWQGLAIISLLVVVVAVFTATRSGSLPAAQRFERLSLQGTGSEEAGRGPLVPIEALRDPIVTLPDSFGTIDSLKDVPAVPFTSSGALSRKEEPELPRTNLSAVSGPDAVAQTWAGSVNMPAPIANFDGISLADQGIALSPPDTNGDIGYDPATGKRYYFQWINLAYKAWDVTNPASPVVVVPLANGNALWQAALPGTPCANTNDGDPIVLFDEQAHRWFISQFAVSVSFHQCVAVSQTANPAGAWYVYDYPYRDGATYFNDYPHFGVWPDTAYNAYFMTMHEFNAAGTAYLGQSVSAFDRAKLLVGDSSAPLVTFALGTNYGGMLPADLDGTPPASGTPGFFFMTDPAGTLQIWEFKPDWTTPANSVVGVGGSHTPNYSLPITAYTDACSTCVPQLGTTRQLDSLGDRLMHRVAFRALNGGIQTAVLNHTVDVDGAGGSARTGVRWYEVRRNSSTGAWTLNQHSTYAPGTTDYRWMGSIATDQAGNIALGFSASNSSSYPSIRYAGRLFTDTPNALPQAEITMTVSTGAQTGSNRWGDYSMLGVDPQDSCTFWYTQEYNGATASLPWKTRIGSFKFAECTSGPTGALSGTVRNASNSSPINGANVVAQSSIGAIYNSTTNASGIYQLVSLPIGTYTVTASAGGYNSSTATGVAVTASITTTRNFTLTTLPQADLSLVKSASAAMVAPGGSLGYTLTVTNNGPDTITTTLTVTDVLPTGYMLSTASGAGWTCNGATTVVCTRSGLGASASSSINLTGLAPNVLGLIANTATVTASPYDASPANNTSAVNVTVAPQTDLAIAKTGPAVAAPGATLVYTISVSNNGSMAIGPFTATYTNSAAIPIPDNLLQMVTSTINVAGLPPVQVARAGLLGFTHTWPEDIDTLLVAPGGQNTILMSDPRGGASPSVNIDLLFDDTAPAILCSSGVLTGGTYHPTDCPNDSGDDTFPSPAPVGPYTATLSVFNAANPNGVWNLFARDDAAPDSGGFNNGWTLTLVGAYSLTVTDTLPAGTTFVGATGNGWNCAHLSGVVTCTRSDLAPGAAPSIAITVTAPATIGLITNTAVVGSSMNDIAPANNIAQFTTNLVEGVSVTPGAASQSALPGAVVTYTLAVTNTSDASDTYTLTVNGNSFVTNAPSSVGPVGAGASTTFNVVVTVPIGAAGGAFDTANVKVMSRNAPSKFASSVLTTTASVVRGVALAPSAASQSAVPGAVVTYTLAVTNTGNASDAYTVTVNGNSFVTNVLSSVGPLGAGATTTFKVAVLVPVGAAAGALDTVNVKVASQSDPSKFASSVLTTTTSLVRGVALTPSALSQLGASGAVVTFTLAVTNTGNVSDTFTVLVSGNAFGATSPLKVGPLSAGATTTFDVVVAIPPATPSGTLDTANVKVTSQSDGLITANSNLTTIAAYSVYLPLVLREP
jgi:uncharacterized repeat protein (TIGR01451 family)